MSFDRDETGRFELDRRLVRRSFDLASATYDTAAVLQTEVRERLQSRLDYVRVNPETIADLGAGTGHGPKALKRRYPRARVVAVDLAFGMLLEARRQQRLFRRFDLACADAARLPLRDRSLDLIFSNLMLQWCDDPYLVFREAARTLRQGGLLTFTTFGPDTLMELRRAWAATDSHTHVNRFIDMHDLGDALVRAGLADPVLDVEHLTLTYQDVRGLMRDLKAIGAHNVTRGRIPGLTGRRRFAAMLAAYDGMRRGGLLPATYEVIYGHAWAVDRRQPSTMGEATVPVASLRRRNQD